MKKKLLTLAVALLAATGAWAQEFTFDNLKYTVTDAAAKTVELTGYVTKPTGALTIPATVTNEGTEYSVTSIGSAAFISCSSLTAVTIPDGVTQIGDYAFNVCSALTKVTIPASVTSIGSYAFEYCHALTAVTIPDGVTQIGDYAFNRCSALTAINVAESNSDYCSDGGVLFNKDKTTLIQYPIGKPETSYIIPEGVTSVGGYAFAGCKALTAVTIPVSVTGIEIYAFGWSNNITELTVAATVPPTVKENAFYSVSKNISVYVPKESLEAYRAADGWKEFTNLKAISTTGLQTPAMPESIRIQGGTLHNPQGLHLTLYDMQGRQVYSGTAATVSQPAGVYVVRCAGASGKVLF